MKFFMIQLILLLAVLGISLTGCDMQPATQWSAPAGPGLEINEQVPIPDKDKEEPSQVREITDMAGRLVSVPNNIESVFATDPVASIYIYTFDPDKLLGWNFELNETERSVVLPQYHSLPVFGMGSSINYEAVIAAEPTIALVVSRINENSIERADTFEESLGIPAILLSSDLEDTPEVYRILGELLGLEERGEVLAAYAARTFDEIEAITVPEESIVRIYYGNGEDSLQTSPAGAPDAQVIEMIKAVNVAELDLGEGSRIRISPEQLLAWNPDVIVLNGEPRANLSGVAAAQLMLSDSDFTTVQAIMDGRVYGIPGAPFGWVERPPGPNRVVGIRWLAATVYPDYVNFNLDFEVREFFRLFYHVELRAERLAEVYGFAPLNQ